MEPIELDYQLTAREWRNLTIRRRFSGKSGLGILAIASLVGAGMWFTQSGSTTSKVIATACGFFGYLALMVILFTISAIRAWRSNPDLHRVRHYVITPDEVLVTTDLSTSAISWEFFFRHHRDTSILHTEIHNWDRALDPKAAASRLGAVCSVR